jgi:hypothetical protein
MPGLKSNARQTINAIRNQLRDQYGPGSVVKEIIQNADDAGATHVAIIGCIGLAGAHNPLLRAPGLLVVNDGPLTRQQFDAMAEASGSDKARDIAKVGRFGLGQKALFNLCDAFVVQGWIEDEAGALAHQIINPFVELDRDADSPAQSWESFDDADRAVLVAACQAAGFSAQGVALYIPLRSATLRPSPGVGFTTDEPDLAATLRAYGDRSGLIMIAAALRHVQDIAIGRTDGPAERLTVSVGSTRLAGPTMGDPFAQSFAGSITGAPDAAARFSGREQQLGRDVARRFTEDSRWPTTVDHDYDDIREKAAPHGAVIITRATGGEEAALHIHLGTFLPVGAPLASPIPLGDPALGRIDLFLHGYFFVDSGRRLIAFDAVAADGDQSLRNAWNAMVRKDAMLPLIQPLLLAAFADLDLTPAQRRLVTRALRSSPWWRGCAADASAGTALVEALRTGGAPAWSLAPAVTVRPLAPIGEIASDMVMRLFPDLLPWAADRGLVLTPDKTAVLAVSDPIWPDDELAALLDTLDARALHRNQPETATPFGQLLDAVLADGYPRARRKLVEIVRQALIADGPLASPAALARILTHAPANLLFALPNSVENRQILRALASASSDMLAIRAATAPSGGPSPIATALPVGVTIAWLTALEPLLTESGDLGEQANAAAAAILGAGPALTELLLNERARHLRVVRIRRVGSSDFAPVSLAELAELAERGRLFTNQPGGLLPALAAAVDDVALYAVRLPDGSGAATKLRLQGPGSAAAAARILADVGRFGSVEARGQLLTQLLRHEGVDAGLLRALCIGEPLAAQTDAVLLALPDMVPALARLAMAAAQALDARKLVPPLIADSLSGADRRRLGISEFDLFAMADLIAEAHQSGALCRMSDDDAQAILASSIGPDIVRRLPVFRTRDGRLAVVDAPLFRMADFAMSPLLATLVAVLDPWPDPLLARAHDVVPEWSPGAQISAALAQSRPELFAEAILDALADATDAEITAARRDLLARRWIPDSDSGARSGSDIVCLAPEVDAELRALIPDAPFVPFDQLPSLVRDHRAAERLRDWILPGVEESQAALHLLVDQAGLIGIAVDPGAELETLSLLASARCDLSLPAWPLLSALLRATPDPSLCLAVAEALCGIPAPDQLVLHLNALAAATASALTGLRAASRLHETVFTATIANLVSPAGTLPAELLLPAMSGSFRRANQIAPRGQGLDLAYVLQDRYAALLPGAAEIIGRPEHDGANSAPQITDIAAGRAAFAATIAAYFEPWRGLVPADAIVFLLGLLGRDADISAVAVTWEAETRRGLHGLIWDAIDEALAPHMAADDLPAVLADTLMRATIVVQDVQVRSAAGPSCSIPLAAGASSLLVGDPLGTRHRAVDIHGRRVHVVELALVQHSTSDRASARSLFERFIDGLCPALLLTMPTQRDAVRQAFETSFEIEQVTIDEAIAKLRDQAPSHIRTLVLPDTGAVRTALHAFDAVPATQPTTLALAKNSLWSRLLQPEAADELLTAVRAKIAQMGYSEARVLFELLQNADDAYVQMDTPSGALRIEVTRDEAGASQLSLVHWGRPINHPGRGMSEARQRGFRNDLYNMLAINHSEKPAEAGTTGKFGLGFKTVHMITSAARVASGFIAAEIVGGFLPREWSQGVEAARDHARDNRAATLIELPVDPDKSDQAATALAAFLHCVEWLPAVARRIREIIVVDGTGRTFGSHIEPLPGDHGPTGLAVTRNHGERQRRALRIDLGDDFVMLLGLGLSGPERIASSSALWNLVPLEEQSQSGWILNGPFEVDPGRSHIKGSVEEQNALFRQLGTRLGDRLIALFDRIEQDPPGFAAGLGIDPTAMPRFWATLTTLFDADIRQGREAQLHLEDRGLSRLWRARPAVATGLASPCEQPVRAADVRFRAASALSNPAVYASVAGWPSMVALAGTIVSSDVGERLVALRAASPASLPLATLLAHELGPQGQVDRATAARIGAVLTLAAVERQEFAIERNDLLTTAATALFLSRAETWAGPRLLVISNGGDELEDARAAFAPDENRLSADYDGAALDFFRLSRARSGYAPTLALLRGWAERATDIPRQRAFLRYLLRDPNLARAVGEEPLDWLPSPLGLLRGNALCAGWTDSDITLLLALMAQLPPYQPPPLAPPIAPPANPTDFLEAIHDWWVTARAAEIPAYDESLYPEDFDFTLLPAGDPTAWFTMFAIAVFHTLGRTQEEQCRGFIQRAMRDGWWTDLADLATTADQQAWIDRLHEWSDPHLGDQFFVPWHRCLVDLYAVARFLPEFIRIIRSLPAIIRAAGDIALRDLTRPFQSQIVATMGINAATIDRSIGMGINWLIRELVRNAVYTPADARLLQPYCWTASRRVRRLLRCADIELGPPGDMDLTSFEYDEIVAAIGPIRAQFSGDFDLPLQLIARRDYREELLDALDAAGIDRAVLAPLDEDE